MNSLWQCSCTNHGIHCLQYCQRQLHFTGRCCSVAIGNWSIQKIGWNHQENADSKKKFLPTHNVCNIHMSIINKIICNWMETKKNYLQNANNTACKKKARWYFVTYCTHRLWKHRVRGSTDALLFPVGDIECHLTTLFPNQFQWTAEKFKKLNAFGTLVKCKMQGANCKIYMWTEVRVRGRVWIRVRNKVRVTDRARVRI